MGIEDFIPLRRPAPPARRCGSYASGHDVHSIQVLRVAPGKHRERITDVTTTGETTLRLTVDPSGFQEPHAYEPRVVHHHQPARLQHLWDERHDGAFVAGAHLVLIGTPRVHTAFSVSRSPIDPCRTDTAEWLAAADLAAGTDGAADGGAG